ncbi:endolytic transglycosylase MltG [Nitrospira sp. Kam-Ns4a]
MHRALATVLVAAGVSAAGALGYQGLQWAADAPAGAGDRSAPRTVDVPDGATFRDVAALLEREGLLASRWPFLLLGKLQGADRRVVAGEYVLHPGMTPREILSALVEGRVALRTVTIPEGYTVAQIADLLSQTGVTDPGDFLTVVRDQGFIRTLGIEAPSLEGYLFPNTYRFARRTDSKEVAAALVEGLRRAFTAEWRDRASDIGLSVHQVLTLASVIEKETNAEGEYELVSAVFHNRLRRGIPLQSDPTVIYALGAFDGDLKKRDLSVASPYNTYRVAGLPPGPIANPGAKAIRAALYPAPVPYLYFVSRNDGTHVFSTTLAEHNRAVEKYQRRGARRLS